MSRACRFKEKSLRELDGTYLQLSRTKGALRCLRNEDDVETAQGLYFQCPVCEDYHGITILFDGVDPALAPQGRYLPLRLNHGNPGRPKADSLLRMPTLDEVTIVDKIRPTDIPCAFTGFISMGKVKWK